MERTLAGSIYYLTSEVGLMFAACYFHLLPSLIISLALVPYYFYRQTIHTDIDAGEPVSYTIAAIACSVYLLGLLLVIQLAVSQVGKVIARAECDAHGKAQLLDFVEEAVVVVETASIVEQCSFTVDFVNQALGKNLLDREFPVDKDPPSRIAKVQELCNHDDKPGSHFIAPVPPSLFKSGASCSFDAKSVSEGLQELDGFVSFKHLIETAVQDAGDSNSHSEVSHLYKLKQATQQSHV